MNGYREEHLLQILENDLKEFLKEGELGVEEIKEELKRKGFKVADQRLRDILRESVERAILTAGRVGPKKIVFGLNVEIDFLIFFGLFFRPRNKKSRFHA